MCAEASVSEVTDKCSEKILGTSLEEVSSSNMSSQAILHKPQLPGLPTPRYTFEGLSTRVPESTRLCG